MNRNSFIEHQINNILRDKERCQIRLEYAVSLLEMVEKTADNWHINSLKVEIESLKAKIELYTAMINKLSELKDKE